MAKGKHLLGRTAGKYVFGTVKVGEKGQIVIPRDARKAFGIEPGDTLLILGDLRTGLIVSRPEAVNEMATRILTSLEDP